MTFSTTDAVMCSAGITGIAAAYYLVIKRGVKDVVLTDSRAPLLLMVIVLKL